jgi:tetratricopeptide (TPR) repeat protein
MKEDPYNPTYLHDTAYVFITQGMFVDAIGLLKKAIEIEPKSPKLWISYITCVFHLKNYDDALKLISIASSKSLITDEEKTKLKKAIKLRIETGRDAKYDNLYNDYAEVAPSDVLDSQATTKKISQLINDDIVSPIVYVRLLNTYYQQTGSYDLGTIEKIIDLGNINSDLHVMLSKCLKTNLDISGAIKELNRAIEIRPTNIKAHLMLFEIFSENQDFNQLVRTSNKICSLGPDEEIVEGIVKHLFGLHLFGACLEAIDASKIKLKKNGVCRRIKGCCLILSKQYISGLEILEEYAGNFYDEEKLIYATGLLEVGNLSAVENFIAKHLNPADPQTYQIKAKLDWKKGCYENGLKSLRDGTERFDFNKVGPALSKKKNFSVKSAKEVVKEASALLEQAEIIAWLDFGTLLGYCRDGRPLAFDKDCDLGTLETDAQKIIQAVTSQHTFILASVSEDANGRCLSLTFKNTSTYVTLDIFIYHETSTGFETGFDYKPFPILWEFKERPSTVAKEFDGTMLPCLECPERHLETIYGPQWTVPDPYFDTVVSAKNLKKTSIIASKFYGFLRAINSYSEGHYEKCQMLLEQVDKLE